VIGCEARGVKKLRMAKSKKNKEQTEAQPDFAGGATKQTGTNGLFSEAYR
jgi:hypothetical protein